MKANRELGTKESRLLVGSVKKVLEHFVAVVRGCG